MASYESIRQGWNRVRMTDGPEEEPLDENTISDEVGMSRKTFISSGAIFEGTLSLKGDFHIDTEFRGELETDGTITVGPEGNTRFSMRRCGRPPVRPKQARFHR